LRALGHDLQTRPTITDRWDPLSCYAHTLAQRIFNERRGRTSRFPIRNYHNIRGNARFGFRDGKLCLKTWPLDTMVIWQDHKEINVAIFGCPESGGGTKQPNFPYGQPMAKRIHAGKYLPF
jgi:hypothetical protein